jgi:predicted permease
VGTAIELNGLPHIVVGIIPARFVLPEADVWVPLVFAPYEVDQRGNRALSIVARLATGVSLEAAREQARTVAGRLEAEAPTAHSGWDIGLESLKDDLVGATRTPLLILFAATCLVLLAACANLAGLMLVRSAAREREIALRVALGANRGRVVRLVVTEAMVLAALAAVIGVGLARLGITVVTGQAGTWLPAGAVTTISPAVLLFLAVMTAIAGLTLAILPALEAARCDLLAMVKGSGSAPRGGLAIRDVTTASQMALALVLLVGGGLLVQSFLQAQRVDPGFTARGVVAMTLSLPGRYAEPEQRAGFFAQLESRVAALTGVSAAGFVSHLPLSGGTLVTDLVIGGREAPQGDGMTAQLVNVTPGYFESLGILLRAGRGFSESDRLGTEPVVVVDAELARRYWPRGDAVGQRMRLGATLGADTAWRKVIGVVGPVRAISLERVPEPAIYIPHAQNPWPSMTLTLRSDRLTEAIVQAAIAEVHTLDRTRPVYAIRYIDDILARVLAPRRLQMLLMSGFAGTVLIIAVLGIYGMLAHAVAQRNRELGVRMALGARRGEIVWYCLRRALTRMAAGLVIGLVGALAGARLLASMLFGLEPWDPFTLIGATLLLLITALAASAVPAIRAAMLDPARVLRQD